MQQVRASTETAATLRASQQALTEGLVVQDMQAAWPDCQGMQMRPCCAMRIRQVASAGMLQQVTASLTSCAPAGCALLAKAMATNGGLRQLDLSRCGCNDAAAGAWGETLRVNKVLEVLHLDGSDITDAGVAFWQ